MGNHSVMFKNLPSVNTGNTGSVTPQTNASAQTAEAQTKALAQQKLQQQTSQMPQFLQQVAQFAGIKPKTLSNTNTKEQNSTPASHSKKGESTRGGNTQAFKGIPRIGGINFRA